MKHRTDRVAELLRAELNDLFLQRLKDPRVRLASVSEVIPTADHGRARVRVSVLGPDEEREAVIEAIRHAAGFLRRELGRRIHLRQTPELVFELDHGAEHSQRISDLLEELHARDETP